MRTGVVVSTVLHAVLLTWGLWSLSAPAPLQVANVDAMPVDLVPVESLSQAMAGDKDAKKTDKPSPKQTKTPQKLPMPAQNIGDNETDLATPPTPVERPKPTEQAAAAAKSADTPPAPKDVPEPTPPPPPQPKVAEKTPEPKPTPKPPEPKPAEKPPEPKPADVKPAQADAVEEAIADAAKQPDPTPVPKNVPVPQDKPSPPKPEKAETPPEPKPAETPKETKVAEAEKPKPAKPAKPKKTETSDESKFDADKIAQLLNKEKSAGGGAKRSEQQASLGMQHTTGAKLSQSELDALRGQIQKCWSPPAGVEGAGSLRVSIEMHLDPSGQLQGRPVIVDGGSGSMQQRIAGEAALRAVRRCAPYNLPADKYETWSEVVLNFDPSQMF
ncbi:hypothetical protein [Jiella sp. M17.18]|uniref:cell envelope integrity protein TolA n=1 Tax=Jiella sp. M17.18 TaxID=3234247 RepID=UPI0034DF1872